MGDTSVAGASIAVFDAAGALVKTVSTDAAGGCRHRVGDRGYLRATNGAGYEEMLTTPSAAPRVAASCPERPFPPRSASSYRGLYSRQPPPGTGVMSARATGVDSTPVS